MRSMEQEPGMPAPHGQREIGDGQALADRMSRQFADMSNARLDWAVGVKPQKGGDQVVLVFGEKIHASKTDAITEYNYGQYLEQTTRGPNDQEFFLDAQGVNHPYTGDIDVVRVDRGTVFKHIQNPQQHQTYEPARQQNTPFTDKVRGILGHVLPGRGELGAAATADSKSGKTKR